ncbi:MAG: flagellar basal-body MS-ring/collar protein FliF [Sulfurimonas sp.]|jgi:flagellar M-ring protein FliF|nr:flagellar basal-body MS-ring/collar protein FliF [Sulfurimonadaceae bacterium]
MDFKALISQLSVLYSKLTKAQRTIIASAVVGIVAFLVFLVVYTTNKENPSEYDVLFSTLSSSDAAKVVEQLEKDNVPYEIGANNTIRVPKAFVYKQRLNIASLGIPNSNGVGYELFDKQEFGATSFDQNVKYLRAIEGELARTIEALDPIQSATVSLALPKETLFVEKKSLPTASVMIRLNDGRVLNSKQIRGIKNLVASSVQNLTPQNVTLIDSDGETLGDEDAGAQLGELSIVQQSYKTKEEKKLQRKIVEVVSPFVGGEDKVVAQVSIDYDFSLKETTSETYDPDSVVRSEQSTEEKREGSSPSEVGGIPGAVSNIGPVEGLEDSSSKERYEKNQATTNYEIGKTVSITKSEFARIQRITAAVVVDGKYKLKLDDDGNRLDELEYEPISEGELEALEALVSRSIGLKDDRGDLVSVKNLQFRSSQSDDAKNKVTQVVTFSKTYLEPFAEILKYLLVAIILFVLYKKVISPFSQRMLEAYQEEDDVINKPKLIFEDDEDEDLAEKAKAVRKKVEDQLGVGEGFNEDGLKYEVILEKIKDMIEESPEGIAGLLQALLAEENEFSK